jgi:hypothetical protein
MTKSWSIELPETYRRRFADGNLALWRDGMTHWVAVWTIPGSSTAELTFDWIKNDRPEALVEEFQPVRPGYLCWGFLVEEKTEQGNRWALYSYTIGKHAYVQMATYIDERVDLDKALKVWRSLEETDASVLSPK